MSIPYLIDSIVRQTTVLLAQLATAGGVRAPLAHIAEQVFVELAAELEQQGVSRKVSADMFGMALRTYQRRTQRLRESSSERGRSLWAAVYDYICSQNVVTREQVMRRFRNDEDALVRGVLHDLSESGLVFAAGTGAEAVYRAVSGDELGALRALNAGPGLEALLWTKIYNGGPLRRDQLPGHGTRPDELDAALDRLVSQGRIVAQEVSGVMQYSSSELVIPLDGSPGWEGAVLDHYQALVRTIVARLHLQSGSREAEETGGSTYSFDLWPGHPHEAEVLSSLRRFRAAQSELRQRVDAYNRSVPRPADRLRVTSYAGQSVVREEVDAP